MFFSFVLGRGGQAQKQTVSKAVMLLSQHHGFFRLWNASLKSGPWVCGTGCNRMQGCVRAFSAAARSRLPVFRLLPCLGGFRLLLQTLRLFFLAIIQQPAAEHGIQGGFKGEQCDQR